MNSKPRVLIAFASLKGTLSSLQAGNALARGLQAHGVESHVLALADGGEGIVEALHRAVPGSKLKTVPCRGPLNEKRSATFAMLPPTRPDKLAVAHKVAVIEMAASSGLPLIPERKRDPKLATTLGVGDQIKAALKFGAREIRLGIGGSATNDGGAGMAQALGIRLLDKTGRDLPPGGVALLNLARIDISGMEHRLGKTKVIVACDVRNPLCGPLGASAVYGPQKGATKSDVKLLDAALAHYAKIIKRDLGLSVAKTPGAGAAGGLGAGCLAFLNAELVSGIDLVLDTVKIDEHLKGIDLVITGEGFLDRQTLMGKAPAGVAARAKKAGIPCMAIGGGVETASCTKLKRVFAHLESLSEFAGSKAAAMAQPARQLTLLAQKNGQAWLELISL